LEVKRGHPAIWRKEKIGKGVIERKKIGNFGKIGLPNNSDR